MQESLNEKNPYGQYKELGGIINEADYESALERSHSLNSDERKLQNQAELQALGMAKFAGIELDDLDEAIALYGILRKDSKPDGIQYHHSQMSDQRLFAETLRMLGETGSLQKLKNSYPNISFD